jgi:hypothetical protein
MFMEPMYLDRPPVVDLLLVIAVVGFAVGLIWLHRIGGLGEDPGPSIFRYRDQGTFRRLAKSLDVAPSLPIPSLRLPSLRLPSPIRRRQTIRWLVTRLELGVGVMGLAVAASPFWLPVQRSGYMFSDPDWGMLISIAGTVGCLIGLVWMTRIVRRPAEAGPSIWRSQHD